MAELNVEACTFLVKGTIWWEKLYNNQLVVILMENSPFDQV